MRFSNALHMDIFTIALLSGNGIQIVALDTDI